MGTLTSFFGGGGGSAAPLPVHTFLNSVASWTPSYDGTAYIHVIGAGGNGSSSTKRGGGAGGYCRKLITLSTSDTYTITIGASPTTDGGSGGLSRFTNGSTITLTANGGTNPNGGTASGGDVNYTGGSGGSQSGWNCMSGGGAVNITGTAYNGGYAVNYGNDTGYNLSGGAGVGGNGGDTYGQQNSGYTCISGGGGSGGSGNHGGEFTPNAGVQSFGGVASVGKPFGVVGFDFIKEWGAGGSMRYKYNNSDASVAFSEIQAGVGGGGTGGFNETKYWQGGAGGLFGGGGGNGGQGGLGGGGGGYNSWGGAAYPRGFGGAGVIFVEYVTLA